MTVRKHMLLLNILFAALAVETTVAVPSSTAGTRTETFDPSRCAKNPNGMIYLAFWETVIRWPMEDLFYVGDFPPERLARAPVPPRPDVQEGCPGNPIRAQSFFVGLRNSSISNHRKLGRKDLAPVSRIALFASAQDKPHHSPTVKFGKQGFKKCMARARELGTGTEVRSNGLIVCPYPPADPSMPKARWRLHIRSDSTYLTKSRIHIYTTCSREIVSGGRECDYNYNFYKYVNISVRFNTRYLDIDKIISLDKALRHAMTAGIISDYPWRGPLSPPETGEARGDTR